MVLGKKTGGGLMGADRKYEVILAETSQHCTQRRYWFLPSMCCRSVFDNNCGMH